MTLKVKYREENSDEIKSKKIYCLSGIRKKCIKGCKGIDENVLKQIISKNLKSVIDKVIDEKTFQDMAIEQYKNKELRSMQIYKKEMYKDLRKIDDDAKMLYEDYKKELLDEEDYRKFYQDIKNKKSRIKNEIKIIEKEEIEISTSRLENIISDVIEMKELCNELISNVIYDIEIDNENKIYINYNFNVL